MQGNFPKAIPKRQLSKGIFPSVNFPYCNFPSSNFSSLIPAAALGPLAHPRHRALVPIAAFHCIWKVATWKILTWKVTLGNRLWENTLRGKKIK